MSANGKLNSDKKRPNFRKYNLQDVSVYIAGFPEESRPIMEELRKILKSTVPNAEEGISWGVPFFRYKGMLASFAAFKNHISFGLITVLSKAIRIELEKKGYATGKKTIQINFNQKVPVKEIGQILIAKVKENETKKSNTSN